MTFYRPGSRTMMACLGMATVFAGWARQAEGQGTAVQEGTADEAAAISSVEPREVRVELFMADLVSINGADQSFFADVFLVASWQDPVLAADTDDRRTFDLVDVWHPMLLILNQRSASERLPHVVEVAPDGTVVYLQRFIGTFAMAMDLRRFPVDRQSPRVLIVAPRTALRGPVRLIPDPAIEIMLADSLSISD